MIRFYLNIANPFHNEEKGPWKSLFQREKKISKHTLMEIGFFRYHYSLFKLAFGTEFSGRDHAGPEFEISILGYEFRISFSDTRHWNYDNNCWETYQCVDTEVDKD